MEAHVCLFSMLLKLELGNDLFRLIASKNKGFCVHNISVCTVLCIFIIYICINTHMHVYI